MAKILQAVAKYGRRIELKPTIVLKDVADRVIGKINIQKPSSDG